MQALVVISVVALALVAAKSNTLLRGVKLNDS